MRRPAIYVGTRCAQRIPAGFCPDRRRAEPLPRFRPARLALSSSSSDVPVGCPSLQPGAIIAKSGIASKVLTIDIAYLNAVHDSRLIRRDCACHALGFGGFASGRRHGRGWYKRFHRRLPVDATASKNRCREPVRCSVCRSSFCGHRKALHRDGQRLLREPRVLLTAIARSLTPARNRATVAGSRQGDALHSSEELS